MTRVCGPPAYVSLNANEFCQLKSKIFSGVSNAMRDVRDDGRICVLSTTPSTPGVYVYPNCSPWSILRLSEFEAWNDGVQVSQLASSTGCALMLSDGKSWSICDRPGYCRRVPPSVIDAGPSVY